ncbi:MAG: hypothetical protein ACHQC8_05790 [Solirubrobacterales bacterium]
MSAPGPARWALAAVAVMATLAGANVAQAEGPTVGGTVESTLGLSLGEPSAFARVRAGHRRGVYDATIAVEVTATEEPTRLSLADEEAIAGRRRGRLVRGSSILAIPLRAAADNGVYRSLDATVDPVLEQWGEPVSLEAATIRLRQAVRGAHQPPIGGYHKLLLVTVTAAGP